MAVHQRRDGFQEVNDIGIVCFNACSPLPETGDISVTVAEAWDDDTPRRQILLTCRAAINGVEYGMDVDKAEALGLLLLSASRGMREMSRKLDEEADD